MSQEEFTALVRRMRDAQRRFRESRKGAAEIAAKFLEDEVDAALERMRDGPTLFGEP